jgi:CRP-like cAMP-binding protein
MCDPPEMQSSRSSSTPTVAFFPTIDDEMAARIEEYSKPHALDADGVLFREGDSPARLYLLKEGEATIAVANHAIPCLQLGAGSLIGRSSVLTNQRHGTTATVSPDAQVDALDPSEFLALIDRHPALHLRVLQILASETEAIFDRLTLELAFA